MFNAYNQFVYESFSLSYHRGVWPTSIDWSALFTLGLIIPVGGLFFAVYLLIKFYPYD